MVWFRIAHNALFLCIYFITLIVLLYYSSLVNHVYFSSVVQYSFIFQWSQNSPHNLYFWVKNSWFKVCTVLVFIKSELPINFKYLPTLFKCLAHFASFMLKWIAAVFSIPLPFYCYCSVPVYCDVLLVLLEKSLFVSRRFLGPHLFVSIFCHFSSALGLSELQPRPITVVYEKRTEKSQKQFEFWEKMESEMTLYFGYWKKKLVCCNFPISWESFEGAMYFIFRIVITRKGDSWSCPWPKTCLLKWSSVGRMIWIFLGFVR